MACSRFWFLGFLIANALVGVVGFVAWTVVDSDLLVSDSPSDRSPSAEESSTDLAAPVAKENISNLLLALGCVVTMSSFCYPIVVIWSVGGDMTVAANYYSKCDLGATSLSTIAWLLFGVSQLHVESGKMVGIAAIVSNSVGVAFIGLTIVMKIAEGQPITTKVCSGAFVGLHSHSHLSYSYLCLGLLKGIHNGQRFSLLLPLLRNWYPKCCRCIQRTDSFGLLKVQCNKISRILRNFFLFRDHIVLSFHRIGRFTVY